MDGCVAMREGATMARTIVPGEGWGGVTNAICCRCGALATQTGPWLRPGETNEQRDTPERLCPYLLVPAGSLKSA